MAALNGMPATESRSPTSSPSSSTMKLPQMLRRGSTLDNNEKHTGEQFRRVSFPVPEPERRSSLSTIPLRLRRKKTQSNSEIKGQDTEAAERLGRLFFSLPSEIVTQIVTYLTLTDIYTLRLTSRVFNTILDYNATTINRSIIYQTLDPTTYPHIQTHLYPPNLSTTDTTQAMTNLLAMVRRHRLLSKQTANLLAFIQMKIYMTRTATRVLSVHDKRQRLTYAFLRPAWFVNHFLESYRDILIYQHPSHPPSSSNTTTSTTDACPQCTSLARAIVASYPAPDILPSWHYYQLTLSHLQISTRTPQATGALERRLRGWSKAPVTGGQLAVFVILGGLPEVRKVAMMQGSYGSRVGAMADFADKVREAVASNTATTAILATAASGSRRNSARAGSVSVGVTPVGVDSGVAGGDAGNLGSAPARSLAPPLEKLTQQHIASLPDVTTFFYDVWRDRMDELEPPPAPADIEEPYPWIQRVMEGSGVQFGVTRPPVNLPLALGASPL